MIGMPKRGNGMPQVPDGMPQDGNGMPHKAGGMPGRPLTGKPHPPCSSPPKPRGAAYDHRPAAGPGRPPRRTRRLSPDHEEVRVILPGDPPPLTPPAARTLLRILLDARAKATDYERRERP
jgi:hypothetical protein